VQAAIRLFIAMAGCGVYARQRVFAGTGDCWTRVSAGSSTRFRRRLGPEESQTRYSGARPIKPNPYEWCGDNQACAETTMASMPVSKVGWITGAKRGL